MNILNEKKKFSSYNNFHITEPNRRKFNICDLFSVHNSWVTGDHSDFTHPAPRNLNAQLCEGVRTQTNMIRYSTHVRTNTLRETMYDHTYYSRWYACACRQVACTYARACTQGRWKYERTYQQVSGKYEYAHRQVSGERMHVHRYTFLEDTQRQPTASHCNTMGPTVTLQRCW